MSSLTPEVLEELLLKIKNEREALKAQAAEAHSAAQELKQVIREGREMIKALLEDGIKDLVQAAAAAEVENMTNVVRDSHRKAVAKVFKDLDAMFALLAGE